MRCWIEIAHNQPIDVSDKNSVFDTDPGCPGDVVCQFMVKRVLRVRRSSTRCVADWNK
jgi:hypothetical protein